MSILHHLNELIISERDSDVQYTKWVLNTYNSLLLYVKKLDNENKYPQGDGIEIPFPENNNDDAYIFFDFENFLPKDDWVFTIHKSSHVWNKPLRITFAPYNDKMGGSYTPNTASITINCDYDNFTNLYDIVVHMKSTIIHEMKHLVQSLITRGKSSIYYQDEIKKHKVDYSFDTHPEIYNNLTDEINVRIVEFTIDIFSDKKNRNINFNTFYKLFMDKYPQLINKKKITPRIYSLYQDIMSGKIDINELSRVYELSDKERESMGREISPQKQLNRELKLKYDWDMSYNIWDLIIWHTPEDKPLTLNNIYDIIGLYQKYNQKLNDDIYSVGLYYAILEGNNTAFNEFIKLGAVVDAVIDNGGDVLDDNELSIPLYNKALKMTNDDTKLKYKAKKEKYDIFDSRGNIDYLKFIKVFSGGINDGYFLHYAKKLFDGNLVLLLSNSAKNIISDIMYDDLSYIYNNIISLKPIEFNFMNDDAYDLLYTLISSDYYDRDDIKNIYDRYNKLLPYIEDYVAEFTFIPFLDKIKKLINLKS